MLKIDGSWGNKNGMANERIDPSALWRWRVNIEGRACRVGKEGMEDLNQFPQIYLLVFSQMVTEEELFPI